MAIGPDIKRMQVYRYSLFIIAHSLFLVYQSNGSYQILMYNNIPTVWTCFISYTNDTLQYITT